MKGIPYDCTEHSMFGHVPVHRKFHSRLLLTVFCLAVILVFTQRLPLRTPGLIRPSTVSEASPDAEQYEELGEAADAEVRPFDPTKYDDIDEGSAPSPSPRASYSTDDADTYEKGGPPISTRHLYREIFSLTTHDGSYLPISWGKEAAYNPNLIPHPEKKGTWIIIAQHEQSAVENLQVSEEFALEATIRNGVLSSEKAPAVMPIEPSLPGSCDGKFTYFNFRHGPRDARVFYSPHNPIILYGSQSQYTCIGIWAADARPLLSAFDAKNDGDEDDDSDGIANLSSRDWFHTATEIHRPKPWHGMEKNFFLFWDQSGNTYAHYDVYPKRVFAQVKEDGTVGEDLAVQASDEWCLARHMPRLAPKQESIHQATNSLSITLCHRGACEPDDTNTFIMHVFHHKRYWDYHGEYEPYALLFRRSAPFALHAVAQRPYWIHGRSELSKETKSLSYKDDANIPQNQTEMFYVTSISWKEHGQKYHGYLDDSMWLGFGIEDTRAGAIDVEAGELLQDLAFC